jgi:hypothetical protein
VLDGDKRVGQRAARALTFASINLWITMVASIVTATIWAILAFQRFVYGEPALIQPDPPLSPTERDNAPDVTWKR